MAASPSPTAIVAVYIIFFHVTQTHGWFDYFPISKTYKLNLNSESYLKLNCYPLDLKFNNQELIGTLSYAEHQDEGEKRILSMRFKFQDCDKIFKERHFLVNVKGDNVDFAIKINDNNYATATYKKDGETELKDEKPSQQIDYRSSDWETVYPYTLYAFERRGRSEALRFLLSYHVDEGQWRNVIVDPEAEEWTTLKESVPFGKLPVLAVGGRFIPFVSSIARHLNKECDDHVQLGIVENLIDEMWTLTTPYQSEVDKEKKKALTESVSLYFSKLEGIAQGEKLGCKDKLSWVDFYFVAFVDHLKNITPTVTLPTKLKSLRDEIILKPKIKKWLEEREKY